MDKALYMFIAISIITSFIFSHLINKIRRKKATFGLYEARDKFILLAASGKVDEDSPFFKYYYKRINTLLSHAPNIGIDDAVKMLIKNRRNGNFSKDMENARLEHERVQKCKEIEDEDAAEAAKFYYIATREMILAHSSIVRLTYYALSNIGNDFLRKAFSNTLPRKTQRAIAAIKFSSEEAQQLSERQFAH